MKAGRRTPASGRITIAALVLACGAGAAVAFSAASSRMEAVRAAAALAAGGGLASSIDPNADPASGKVFGEFEDLGYLERRIAKAPAMKKWNDEQAWDGLSGATIQAKTMGPGVPDRIVLLEGRAVAYADGFGQYWCDLPPGTYTLVGRCEGYRDAEVRLEVKPRSVIYANFYLRKKAD